MTIEVSSTEPLEEFLLLVQTELSAALKAELDTIRGDIAEIKAFVHEVREFATSMTEHIASNPALSTLLGQAGGFGF